MAETVLSVSSEISKPAGFSYVGGSGNFTNLQSPDDDASTYLAATQPSTGQAKYNLSDAPSEVGVISNVRTRYRAIRNPAGVQTRVHLKDAGGTQNGGFSVLTGAWANYTDDFPTDSLSAVWTIGVLNGASIEWNKTDTSSGAWLTTLEATVTYEPAPGGWMSLISGLAPWVLFSIGSNLALRDIVAMLSLAEVARRLRASSQAEVRQALREFQSWKRPRFAAMNPAWSF